MSAMADVSTLRPKPFRFAENDDAERRALAWLDRFIREHGDSDAGEHCRVIESMLSRPALPEHPDRPTLHAMTLAHTRRRGGSQLIGVGDAEEIYRELRAYLIAPKTKTVWFVTGGAGETNHGLTLEQALSLARVKAELGYTVTLRRHEVPAD